jgi:antitoxin CcdA
VLCAFLQTYGQKQRLQLEAWENLMRTKINLSVDPSVVAEAKALGMNLSSVAERALLQAIKAHKNRQWQEEHGAALGAYGLDVERDAGGGPPRAA